MENYEQKYNKLVNAIKVLQKTNPSDEGIQNWVNDNVPELKESEDERIRKEIIAILQYKYEKFSKDPKYCNAPQWLAWLEKQGQKPTWTEEDRTMAFTLMRDVDKMSYISKEGKNERIGWLNSLDEKFASRESTWSEEDERNLQGVIDEIEANKNQAPDYDLATYDRFLSWLKSLKDKVIPQPKQEWSEEDERILYNVKAFMGYAAGQRGVREDEYKEANDWLESLKQRHTWKPRIEEPSPKEDNNVNDETNAPTEYGKYIDKCLNEASKHFFSEGEDKYSVADLFYAGVRCGKKYDKSPKDAIVIEGICSDKDFIDTKHGILAFGAEEGSYRLFNDGDRVNIIITKG